MYNYDETKPYDEINALDILVDLEDAQDDSKVAYEVWAIGYDADDEITDAEFLLKSFEDPDEAVAYVKELQLADVVHLTSDGKACTEDVAYLMIEVETVIDYEDSERCTTNVGTIFWKPIDIAL